MKDSIKANDAPTSCLSCGGPLARDPKPLSLRRLVVGVSALALVVGVCGSLWSRWGLRKGPSVWSLASAVFLVMLAGALDWLILILVRSSGTRRCISCGEEVEAPSSPEEERRTRNLTICAIAAFTLVAVLLILLFDKH